jgi:hypothetical protein
MNFDGGREVNADRVKTEAPGMDEAAPGEPHLAQAGHQQSHSHSHSRQAGQLVEGRPSQLGFQHDRPAEPTATDGVAGSSDAAAPLPATFPKKRRGRPPGRPNTTVREEDYANNPLVQAWNAFKGERAVPVVPVRIREALTPQSLVHETQKAIYRLPCRETIYFVQGWITARHVASQRPSYINGLLIHSRGQDSAISCVQCVERSAKNALGPFLTCRVLPGQFHNSCSNCKWFDNTSLCSLYTGPKPNRKRKAKEQLPEPPPLASVSEDAANSNDIAIDPALEASGEQILSRPQAQGVPQPIPKTEQAPQRQTKPEMMPVQNGQLGQHDGEGPQTQQSDPTPTAGTADHDPSAPSHSSTENISELAEARSQAESFSIVQFAMPKLGRDEDAQVAHEESE